MSEKRKYGYIRVSSNYQNQARQRDAILLQGVSERDIFIDRQSGKNFNRPEYQKMISLLRPRDEVVILDLDRLGRSYAEMADEWNYITKDKDCDITVINYPLLNTTLEEKSLDRRFIADIIFQLLSYVAEKEREEIRERQKEGIEAARKRGTKFGRSRIPKPKRFDEVYGEVLKKKITNRQAMSELGLKANTYYAFVRGFKEESTL